jgi:hypothetical protein
MGRNVANICVDMNEAQPPQDLEKYKGKSP